MSRIPIFLAGATGYIGGSVLSILLEHKNRAQFDITAFVRSEDKAAKLKSATGVNVVVGSHQDLELVEDLASKADVVFSLADADDLELAKTMLKGSKKRYAATGTQPIFIHISGAAFLVDGSAGMYGPKEVVDDIETARIEAIPSTEFHRNVDVVIVEADQEGYVKTHIVVPGLIYGKAGGKVADSGVQNIRTAVFPTLCSFAFQRGEAGVIGEGKNEWSHVEISEVANLVVLLFTSAIERPSETAHGREGFYFGENGASSFYDMHKGVQQVLIKTGRAKTGLHVPTTLSQDEISKYMPFPPFFLRIMSGNAVCKSSKSRSLGWNPVKSQKDFMESLHEDLELIAAKTSPRESFFEKKAESLEKS
ncbi:hypothetical protein C8J56DRAFT_1011215 [Mycena floridula]|nr:hypothetical protein C8J56DRAFT_1011215 [Mycena floridula]